MLLSEFRIRDPVPFWPRDPDPHILELSDKFLGKKFFNSLKTCPNFCLQHLIYKIILNFVKFVATEKGLTTNFFLPSLLLLFLYHGSGINTPDPQHWLLQWASGITVPTGTVAKISKFNILIKPMLLIRIRDPMFFFTSGLISSFFGLRIPHLTHISETLVIIFSGWKCWNSFSTYLNFFLYLFKNLNIFLYLLKPRKPKRKRDN